MKNLLLHQEITLSFMRAGHTHCLVDGHFGLIKKIYRQSDTDTLDQMAEVVPVQRSTVNNVAQLAIIIAGNGGN